MSLQAKLRNSRWAATFWGGMDTFSWFRFLKRNGFQIKNSSYWHLWVIIVVSFFSILNSFFRLIKEIIYGPRLAHFKIKKPPIFIIGHWRSGTTLLLELLNLDPNLAAPTTYECFAPSHFLLTEKIMPYLFFYLVPTKRPMDAMPAGWDRPQEEEFALCFLGLPSLYSCIAFPNRLNQHQKYLDLESQSTNDQIAWEKAYLKFIKEVSLKNDGKRIVLKSPTNTVRVKTLLKLFPDAKFILITRNPYSIYPSTIHLWRSLFNEYSLEKIKVNDLENYVLKNFLELENKLQRDKHKINSSNFHELKYEDLIADPQGQLRNIYQHLSLGSFEVVLPSLEKYLLKRQNFKTNKFKITQEIIHKISQEWGEAIAQHDYKPPLLEKN